MKKFLLSLFILFIGYSAYSQSNCSSAVTLTQGTQQCGTNSYAGDFDDASGTPENPCNSYYNDGEYWFEYVGTGGELQLDVSGLSATYSGIYVLDDCPSGTPNCIESHSNGSSTSDYSITTPNLALGTTYYIVIANWASPYETDFCLDATEIAPPTSYPMTNGGSVTDCSGIFTDPEGALSGYNDFNGSYTMTFCSGTAEALQFVFTEFDTRENNDNLTIYDGPNTSSPSLGTFAQTNSPGTITSSGTCLTFVWTTDGNGDGNPGWYATIACVPPPPPNDECVNAVALTVNADLNCGTVTSGTVEDATASSQSIGTCGGTADDDVWYSFVATSTVHEVSLINIAGSTTDMYHAVYEGPCGSLTELECNDGNTTDLSGLSIGTTYFVRVYTWTGTPGQTSTFDVCIGTPPPPPANDECTGAVSLTVNADLNCGTVTSSSTVSATDSGVTTGCSGTADDDVWFSFVATSTAHTVSLDNISGTSTDMYHAIYSGTCGSLTELYCNDGNTTNIGGLTPGNTYYVRVYTYYSSDEADFDICIGTPPPPPANDECSGNITLTVNPDYSCGVMTPGTVASATASGVSSTCFGTADDDVWYSFVATGSGHRVSIENIAGSTTDMYHAIYEGNCGSLTELECNDGNITDLTGLTPGNTYYVQVYTYTSTTGQTSTFDMCVGTAPPPPANDECSDAIDITASINPDESCGIVTAGYTTSATESSESTTCFGTDDDDVWYEFTAPNDTLLISLSNIVGSTTDMYFAVYEGSNCNSMSDVLCSDANSATITGLTIGNTYRIRVYTYSSGASYEASFDLCIGQPEPAGPGEECGTSIAFCTGENYLFPASTDVDGYGDIACLATTPNPAWYFMEVDADGDIVIDITSGDDVDFVAWGPYSDQSTMCSEIDMVSCSLCPNNTTDPTYYPDGEIVDCSYDAAEYETVNILGATSGEFYMLLITNYGNTETNIEFEQTSGAGSANCNIVAPPISSNSVVCEGDDLELYVTYTQPGATYSWSGPGSWTSTDMEPIRPNATVAMSGTYTMVVTVGGVTSDPVTTEVVVSPWTTPTFDAVGPYCSGDAIPALPTTSTNGITGTWSPAINNTATTTYTFTPDAGQCAYTTTL